MQIQDTGGKSELKGLKLTDLDRKNMEYMIKIFKTTPFKFHMTDGSIKTWMGKAWINYVVKNAHDETEALAKQKTTKAKDFEMARRFTMPPPLLAMIKQSYPAIISDTRQFETFLRWFPEFDLKR